MSALNHLTHRMNNLGLKRDRGLNGERREFLWRYSLFPEAVSGSHVADGAQLLLSLYDRENIHILQYERCVADPEGELTRTYSFLGIDDTFVPDGVTKRVNQLEYLNPGNMLYDRRVFAEYFAEDVRRLVDLFPSIDLDYWPDFSADGR